VNKETPKPRDEAFVCMFCGHVARLDEFCFNRKGIEKRSLDYARHSYHNEFTDFPPQSYSHAPPRTPSRAVSCFFHGPNYRSYGFGSRENSFVPKRFGYGPRPHHGDHFPLRHGFLPGGSYTNFESRHLDGPCFPYHGSCPTSSMVEVQKTVKTLSGCMVKCLIPNTTEKRHSLVNFFIFVGTNEYIQITFISFGTDEYKVIFIGLGLTLMNIWVIHFDFGRPNIFVGDMAYIHRLYGAHG
jgi:hypothetical protein